MTADDASVGYVLLGNPAAVESWTLADLQGLALARNPTIVQAQAQVDAARGAAYQAGLRPNPTVGYVAEQIGVNGSAGELQGASYRRKSCAVTNSV